MTSRLELITVLLLCGLGSTAETTCENDVGLWGPWLQWTMCSRPCGTGVSTRTRSCLNELCVGNRLEYRSCCVQVCESSDAEEDFRQEQCSALSSYLDRAADDLGCTIHCVNDLNRKTLISNVLDGTPCIQQESGQRGACLGSLCATVGCDGVLGSDKVEDKCLQCTAPGESHAACSAVKLTVSLSQDTSGNVSMLELPSGASSITVTHHLLSDTGMLAVSLVGQEPQVFGGADLEVGGVLFSYMVTDDGLVERFTARGPLGVAVGVQLVGVSKATPTVEYEYYRITETPDETAPSHKLHTSPITNITAEYVWEHECYGACPVTCGTGLQVSRPVCKDANYPDRVIDDALCVSRGMEKPAPLLRKCSTRRCPPRWVVGDWTGCSNSCGNQLEHRSVMCHAPSNEGAPPVPDSVCSHLPKPEVSQPCLSECNAQWSLGEWSECGEDETQNRTVNCVEAVTKHPINSTYCNHDSQPGAVRACPTGKQCHWKHSGWSKCDNSCGVGKETRRLRCRNVTTNHRVDETCCEGQDKPLAERACFDSRAKRCNVEWRTVGEGQCGGSCCGSQYRVNEVVCAAYFHKIWVDFPNEACAHLPEPPSSVVCNRADCPEWRLSQFEPCPVTCGASFQVRRRECVLRGDVVADRVCEDCLGPRSTLRVCATGPCPTDTSSTPTPPPCEDKDPYLCEDLPLPCGQVHKNNCCASCRKNLLTSLT